VKRGIPTKPEGYPYTVFLLPSTLRSKKFLERREVIEEIGHLDIHIREKHGPWFVIDCRDEFTCLTIAMEFNNYYDGHTLTTGEGANQTITRLSPPIMSNELENLKEQEGAANDR
jgi:hypothetical protein